MKMQVKVKMFKERVLATNVLGIMIWHSFNYLFSKHDHRVNEWPTLGKTTSEFPILPSKTQIRKMNLSETVCYCLILCSMEIHFEGIMVLGLLPQGPNSLDFHKH